MASETSICNRALQKLGSDRIADLTTENSKPARECRAAYAELRDAELRAHPWSFSIARVQLSAAATAPVFGRANSFTLPTGCLRVLPPYPEQNFNDRDWIIEGGDAPVAIYTNELAPLNVRYVFKVTDANKMDPLFREALAAKLAQELAESLTQSNSKKAEAKDDYKLAIREARRVNAIERVPQEPPEDTWITVRA